MEKLHALFLAASVLFVLLVLDGGFKQELHDSSADLTRLIQETSTGFTDWLFRFIDVASLWLVGLIPLYRLATEGVKKGFPLVAAAYIAAGIIGVLKLTYANERPYWAYPDVQAIGCTTGFGHPSGHSLLAGTTYGLFAYYSYKEGRKVLTWALLVGIVIVGYDRLYLGVHSYNQVLIAWGISAVVIFTVLILNISKRDNIPRTVIGSHCFVVLCLVLGALYCAFADPYWDPKWTTAILEKCGKDRNAMSVMVHGLKKTPVTCVFPGFASGLFAYEKFLATKVNWSAVSLKNSIVRFAFCLVVVGCVNFLPQLVEVLVGSASRAIALGLFAYAGGFSLAYVTPLLRFFPEDRTDLSQKLVPSEMQA